MFVFLSTRFLSLSLHVYVILFSQQKSSLYRQFAHFYVVDSSDDEAKKNQFFIILNTANTIIYFCFRLFLACCCNFTRLIKYSKLEYYDHLFLTSWINELNSDYFRLNKKRDAKFNFGFKKNGFNFHSFFSFPHKRLNSR